MLGLAALLPRLVQHPRNVRFGRLTSAGIASAVPRGCLPVLLAVIAMTSALPAHGAEPVAVRAGIHPGFGRLVLEWPAPVEIEGRQDDGRYRLRFERPLEAVLDHAVARLSDYLEGAHLSPDGRQLEFDLAPDVAVRQAVHQGRIVVLDLAPAAPSALVEVRTGLHDGFARIVFEWPVATAFEAVRAARRVTIRFDRAGEIDASGLAARLGAWLSSASASPVNDRSEVRLELQPGIAARAFKVDDRRVAIDLSATPARTAEAVPAVEAPRPAPARPSIAPPATPAPDPGEAQADHVEPANGTSAPGTEDDGAFLEFAWPRPVAAAVFMRAGHLWVVFAAETSGAEDLLMSSALRDHLGQGERIEASGGTALRFALRQPLAVEARRDDRRWQVRLSADAPAPRPVHPLRLRSPARLRLAPGETPRLVDVRDPETGDRLTVWPLLQSNLGQPRQRFVELELLPTAQGLAWRLRSDRVQARMVEDAVEFDAPGGLVLSAPPGSEPIAPTIPPEAPRREPVASIVATAPPGATTDSAPAAPRRAPAAPAARTAAARAAPASEPPFIERREGAPAHAGGSPLGLAGRGLDLASTAPERRSALLQALAQAAPDDRNAHRLELARYHLSKGMAAEALAVLGAVEGSKGEAVQQARHALTGAAELLMGRIDAAAAALGSPAFDADPEAALWRAAVAAGREDWPQAARELERSEQVLATYPRTLQLRLGLAAARTAIETGDAGLAATLLEQLENLELSSAERARLAFLSGVASARTGAIEAADEIWRTLEHDGPVDVRIQAAFARTELLLGAGELEPAEAIARLAATRGLWPGHPWQERMLAGLAQMHADAGDRASALRTWQELLDRYPGAGNAAAITERMRTALIEALRADDEAEFGPVQAYALFREFERLIPRDELGDSLRRRMAERLTALDLIGPAASLLQSVLTDRLGGADRAAAGADLAELWLREPAPEAALMALEQSRTEAALPPALDQRRRILRADALARLEQPTAALELLDGVDTPAADHLRVRILWQERDWPRVVPAIERALERREPTAPLAEDMQAMVLKLALAHSRLGQSAALAQLRTRFAPALRGQSIEPAFLMATTARATTGDPEAVLAVAERHLQRVRGYLEAERATH